MPQESFLFSGTIRDNIAFGRPGATDEDVTAAAQAVGAHDFIERLPDGYDTEVGERGGHLSAGQRQLVAFARAAAADPRILILDEATSNVDVRTEAQIERGLRRLLAGRTAIVIAHRLSTIRNAGRIVVLDHGGIAEQGTHEELLEAGAPTRACTATGRSSRPPDSGSLPAVGRGLALVLWLAALLVLPASASAAVTMTDFKVEPGSKQGGGHPNVTITQTFSYANSTDSVKDAFVRLQPGLLGNPQAAALCTQQQFPADTCPADSRWAASWSTRTFTRCCSVRRATNHGTVYNLRPTGDEPARLGIVVEAGAALEALPPGARVRAARRGRLWARVDVRRPAAERGRPRSRSRRSR